VNRTLDLLPGTLELLILKAVSLDPLHGYGVLLRIKQIAQDRLKIEKGSLYPALCPARGAGADRQRVGGIR
jgi:DNA-binding PadR family transcriptional regulator